MVEGHLGEQVVADVCVGDVVEGVVQHGPEGAVDGAEGTAQPVPLLAAEVRYEDVCVLQVCDEHEVVVGDHVGDQVEERHRREAEGEDGLAQDGEHDHPASDGLHDEVMVLGVEQCRGRREVVSILSSVLGRSCRVKHEVAGPADG